MMAQIGVMVTRMSVYLQTHQAPAFLSTVPLVETIRRSSSLIYIFPALALTSTTSPQFWSLLFRNGFQKPKPRNYVNCSWGVSASRPFQQTQGIYGCVPTECIYIYFKFHYLKYCVHTDKFCSSSVRIVPFTPFSLFIISFSTCEKSSYHHLRHIYLFFAILVYT